MSTERLRLNLSSPLRMVGLAVVFALVILFGQLAERPRSVSAHHDVHYTNYYWTEWAYSPLTAVNAYDCIPQNTALQGSASEWNATGYVLISTQLDNCDLNSNGIRWLVGGSGCNSGVALAASEQKANYLDPDTFQAPTYRALKVNINIGSGCDDGDGYCGPAGGGEAWFYPCDTLTHEMGHALGLADHYYNASAGAGPAFYVFSYPNTPITVNGTQVPTTVTPTVMDYPHRTDIQQHDADNMNMLYRRAPFSPWNLSASSQNFHRINMGWTDRSHNETTFYVERSVAGGAYSFTGSTGQDFTLFGQDIVAPGQQYCYRVYGRNSWGGSGAYSNTSCTTPPNSVGSAIVGSFPTGSTSVGLCWDPAPGSAGVTGYYVLRRRNNGNGTYTNTLYLEPTTTDCFGNGKVAWLGTISSSTYKYHWAVKGCDGSWGCSNYKDMTSPNYQWVQLPWSGSGNTGSPTSGYHSH